MTDLYSRCFNLFLLLAAWDSHELRKIFLNGNDHFLKYPETWGGAVRVYKKSSWVLNLNGEEINKNIFIKEFWKL